jgi:hypothetical protein
VPQQVYSGDIRFPTNAKTPPNKLKPAMRAIQPTRRACQNSNAVAAIMTQTTILAMLGLSISSYENDERFLEEAEELESGLGFALRLV